MNNEEKKCPCQDVLNLQAQCKEQEKRINEGTVNFATINTKLNFVIGALTAGGATLFGVLIKLIAGV